MERNQSFGTWQLQPTPLTKELKYKISSFNPYQWRAYVSAMAKS